MSTSLFTEAKRQSVKPLIGFFGKSGGGKTMSALLMARGLVGPSGRIGLIDSESGRGQLFSDLIPGGYSVLDIAPPFSPDAYSAALKIAEDANFDAIVVDSLSHEWYSEGGVLDMQEAELNRMAGDDWKKREACKMASWIKPKIAHKKFVQRLLRLPFPLICCLRAEEKTHIDKQNNKTVVVTDKHSSPIYDPRFIFELLLVCEIFADESGDGGYSRIVKSTHPELRDCFAAKNDRISVKHGELIAQWAKGGAGPRPQVSQDIASVKKILWNLAKKKFATVPEFEAWLTEKGFADQPLSEMTAEQLHSLTEQIEPELF